MKTYLYTIILRPNMVVLPLVRSKKSPRRRPSTDTSS